MSSGKVKIDNKAIMITERQKDNKNTKHKRKEEEQKETMDKLFVLELEIVHSKRIR